MGDQELKFNIVVKKRNFGNEEAKDKVEGVEIPQGEDGEALHPLSSNAKAPEGESSDIKQTKENIDPLSVSSPLDEDEDPLMGSSSSSSSSSSPLMDDEGASRR